MTDEIEAAPLETASVYPKQRTALYRIFGDADLLLYIGISKDFGRRWRDHAKAQPWWDEHRRMTVEWHPSWDDAKDAETAAIAAEGPKYNIAEAVPPKPRPHSVIPALWEGDGDVLAQIERLLTIGCRNQALITLMIMALIDGHSEVPAGVELVALAAKVRISPRNAYRLAAMLRSGVIAD